MDANQLQQSIIAEVSDISDERNLAQIKAFIHSLRAEVVAGEEHWHSLPATERERMIAAISQPDLSDGTWVSNDLVTGKYRKWFD